MPWTPSATLLSTVREFEQFSHSVRYYEESIGAAGVDPVTGEATPGEVTFVYYPVVITQVAPQTTVITTQTASDPAAINGFYKYIFYDTIIYRDFNDNIKTLRGSGDMGTWEQLDMADCYQMVEFIPDSTRFRTFSFTAEAKNTDGTTRATQTFTIDVSDRSWTSGSNALKNAVDTIRARGN